MRQEEINLYSERCRHFVKRSESELLLEIIIPAAHFACTKEPVAWKDRESLDYKPITAGQHWGDVWESAWFHLEAEIPSSWVGRDIALQLNLSGESLFFDEEGTPIGAVTGNCTLCSSYSKEFFFISETLRKNGKIDLWVEAAGNTIGGACMGNDPKLPIEQPDGYFPGTVKAMKLGIFNRELWHLRIEMEILLEYFDMLPPEDYRRRKMLRAMNEAVNLYADNPANARGARGALKKILELPALASASKVSAVGHAHIDTGYLWPVRETIRKCARTFSNQLDMMEKYPDYVFGASQPQHYAFIKEHYPKLYEKIKTRIAEGRWELQGAMWVEADCNLISGESMVRQFMHGKNFYMDEFGFDVKNLWLPDVFGYSAALPQIIRKSGCDFFLTQKISWNQFNKFPHNTFFWKGIDETEVLTHFPPEDTYNAFVVPQELIAAQNRFKEADLLDEFISLFGIGDGGGGPKEEMIERGLLFADMEGLPKVHFDRADNFFARLAASNAVREHKLAKWSGELYLELHRGTLTTQSRTKRNNRKLEQLLAATEFISSLAPLENYPASELDYAWKKLLLNQFHDIIPGSSIRKVYEVTEKEHDELFSLCEGLVQKAAGAIIKSDENTLTLINTAPTPYTNVIELPESWTDAEIIDDCGNKVVTQGQRALGTLPASGISLWKRINTKQNIVEENDALVLENSLMRYEFNSNGEITRAFDKEVNCETLRKPGNVFSLYIDRPNRYEAWDIDLFYDQEEKSGAAVIAHSSVAAGTVESVISFEWKIGKASAISQTIRLAANSKRLDFETKADWHEDRRMLRVNFPVAVQAAEASFEIQYGYVKRPIHSNTSWDLAKFETVGHRYADISSQTYGVALLNDCKYGYRTDLGDLDLCLLRSPKYPDWNADQGEHLFTYAYLPHIGTLAESAVWSEAVQLNRPPLLFAGTTEAVVPFAVVGGSVSLEVMKKAEKSDELILRLVEIAGRDTVTTLRTMLDEVKLNETNLIEWDEFGEINFTDHSTLLTFKPFEIRTFKVVKTHIS